MSEFVRKNLKFEGMHCRSCEALIKNEVSEIAGVNSIHADYETQKGYVEYDEEKTKIEDIIKAVERKGYAVTVLEDGTDKGNSNGKIAEPETGKKKYKNILGLSAVVLGLFVLFFIVGKIYGMFGEIDVTASMSYGMIFLIGLMTGFHCIAMCGGFVFSYVAKGNMSCKKSHTSHVLYGSGKIISYTVIGALFGLLGGFISFTPTLRATVGLIAGLFLILFGLNLIGVFPILRKFQLKLPMFLSQRINNASSRQTSPFVTGLLNGLMIACGPLQAMYVLSAGTGNMLEGAKIMFIFGLGTLPLLLGFGVAAARMSASTTRNIIKYSGIIVIILGVIMLNRALIISGTGYDAESIASKIGIFGKGTDSLNNTADAGNYQTIYMHAVSSGYAPNKFSLKKGVPVKWIITAKEITGCNSEIIVPAYNLDIRLVSGEQTVEFTPDKAGVVPWSCRMGMHRGSFVVHD